MKTNSFRVRGVRSGESGQVMLFSLLALGLFLLGSIAFAVDLSHLWFQRQAAQTAADAACTAGAMDLLLVQTNNITAAPYPGHFTPGTSFSCTSTTPNSTGSGTTNPAPCVYAALNGFSSSITNAQWVGGTLGDDVEVVFGGAAAPGVSVPANRLMEVDVYRNIPAFFAGLLRGRTTQSVRAVAKCGVDLAAAPIPLIVLDPLNPANTTSSFNIQGNPATTIYGGPQQSIQVNSSDPTAVAAIGSALIDLSHGGPNHTGSNLGVKGGPTTPPNCNTGGSGSGFCAGTTGSWMSPHSPIQDPLRSLQPPTAAQIAALPIYAGSGGGSFTSTTAPLGSAVGTGVMASGQDGCSGGSNCVVFVPGNYTNGICLGTSCMGSGNFSYAVFREGLYVMQGDLTLNSNSCVRPSQTSMPSGTTFNGWGGAIFYFVGNAKMNVGSNAGSPGPQGCDSTQPFNTTTGGLGNGVYCDSTAALPANNPGNVPATLTGNVFLAPCSGPYGDQNYDATKGRQHGVLVFQDRSATSVTSTAGGGGSYALAGTIYLHSCESTGLSATCSFPTGTVNSSSSNYFRDTFQLGGNTGSQSYVLGEIIVDNLVLQGGGSIYMDLNPSTVNNIYKAALYQ
jgi:Flp pilus assembly protein TadG